MSGYFSHDDDARNDPKVVAILKLYPKGYQYFFMTVEYMHANGGELEMNRFLYETLHEQIKTKDAKETEKFVRDALSKDISLFYIAKRDGKRFLRSHRLDDTIEERLAKHSQASDAAKKRWEKEGSKLRRAKKNLYEKDSPEMKLARHFFDKLTKPGGGTAPDWQKWADVFSRMIKLDRRKPEYIEKTIDAVADHQGSGDFRWSKVIKVPDKLRIRMREGKVNPDINKGRKGRLTTQGARPKHNYDEGHERIQT